MYSLDTALSVVIGDAKVRESCTTRVTFGMGTRAAHSRHDQITYLHLIDRWTNFNHLTKCLMADHQIVGTFRGCPIFKSADFFVCAAYANLKHAHSDMIGFSQVGCILLDDPDLFRGWIHCNGFHLFVAFISLSNICSLFILTPVLYTQNTSILS